ncbi:hypothetical protein V6N13_065759 [Hibiscus sabdariffa]
MHATPAMLPVRLVCMQQANFAPAMHAGMQLLRGLDEKACMGSTKPPPEYYSWYLENGKPFLVSVEAGNKWREDPRCSKHRQLTSEFGQSFEEPTDDPYDEPNFDRSRGWPSSWDSVEEQPSFGNVMEFGGRATIIW